MCAGSYSHHRRFTINNIFIVLIINVLIAFATSVIIIACIIIIIITFAIIVVIVEIVITSAAISPHNVQVCVGGKEKRFERERTSERGSKRVSEGDQSDVEGGEEREGIESVRRERERGRAREGASERAKGTLYRESTSMVDWMS